MCIRDRNHTPSTPESVQRVVAKSLAKKRLNLEEVSVLINGTDSKSVHYIKEGAKTLKKKVYGNRIVLFAPPVSYTHLPYREVPP